MSDHPIFFDDMIQWRPGLAEVTERFKTKKWFLVKKLKDEGTFDRCPFILVHWLEGGGYPPGFFDPHGTLYRPSAGDLFVELVHEPEPAREIWP